MTVTTYPISDKFVASLEIESYFVDKDTGFPLAAGVVTFYEDNNRTVKKPVFQLTGTPGNYELSILENPLTLSGVGTFADEAGNNIQIYYYPYEGLPDEESSVVQTYYITVKSEGDVDQLTRENWPPNVSQGGSTVDTIDLKNFISNGQFLVYNDILPANGTIAAQPPVVSVGGVDIQEIAQGGWTFERSTGGTSTFNNSFEFLGGEGISGLNDFPHAFFKFVCNSYNSSDSIRDFCYTFPGVHSLSSGNPPGSQDFTFMFAAESLDVNSYQFQVRVIQNFGTGGTPTAPTDVLISNVTVSSLDYFNVHIPGFPADNVILGTDNNDYVKIVIRGPASSYAAAFTDLALVPGDKIIDVFPEVSQADSLSETIFGTMSLPVTNGWNLYLTPQYTLNGIQFDMEEIGDVIAMTNDSNFVNSLSTSTNRMMCNGNMYVTADYSPLGIPFARLQSKLWDSTYNAPVTGTGIEFATAYIPSNPTTQIRLTTNLLGSQTATGDGAVPTTFTFSTIATGSNTYLVSANLTGNTAASFQVRGNVPGQSLGAVDADAGDSGFTVTTIYNTPKTTQLFIVEVPSLPTAGHYFTFSNTTTDFYVWFTIDGAGSDPAPGGTGILVKLLSTYSAADTAQTIVDVISGYQVSSITTISGATLAAGSYFQFYADTVLYNVWYKVQNVGTAPTVGGVNIMVSVLTADTAAQIATKTQIAINSYSFAAPNLQGLILKGAALGGHSVDPNPLQRFSLVDIYQLTTGINTLQNSANIEHLHYRNANQPESFENGGTPCNTVGGGYVEPTSFTGDSESRPFNYAVNYVIKY